jgi:hypothetical protein
VVVLVRVDGGVVVLDAMVGFVIGEVFVVISVVVVDFAVVVGFVVVVDFVVVLGTVVDGLERIG